ncbi:hypothetical protein B0H65DRAFT_574965 [Neurospora tetraspora]|uniref:Uncharacterized protein n=1 Tax=Neurospora tetraspora TaxID=94610 RepID=A0AAE0JG38_9PEZI|nr:hypothetical protein B0H65DRAFT_574965 [Neurospora tetraspora]
MGGEMCSMLREKTPNLLNYPTEASLEPSFVPATHFQRPYLGSHAKFEVSTSKLVTPQMMNSRPPPDLRSLDMTVLRSNQGSLIRPSQASLDTGSSASNSLYNRPVPFGYYYRCSYFPAIYSCACNGSSQTDGKEIQGEIQSAPGDGCDFGEILNRAMNRASGRLIALLQEELERLSSENELIGDIEETDKALSNLNLDNRKSGRQQLHPALSSLYLVTPLLLGFLFGCIVWPNDEELTTLKEQYEALRDDYDFVTSMFKRGLQASQDQVAQFEQQVQQASARFASKVWAAIAKYGKQDAERQKAIDHLQESPYAIM